MNKIDYSEFKYDEYEPSLYRSDLVNAANKSYKSYASGTIANREHGFEVLAGVDEVIEYFQNMLLPRHKEDINYEVILDDLMLYVDENNAALCSWALIK
tara:strand:+ start:278 stop:574 length:297 start_codon:yes stop_codon:yes gene_type:complete